MFKATNMNADQEDHLRLLPGEANLRNPITDADKTILSDLFEDTGIIAWGAHFDTMLIGLVLGKKPANYRANESYICLREILFQLGLNVNEPRVC